MIRLQRHSHHAQGRLTDSSNGVILIRQLFPYVNRLNQDRDHSLAERLILQTVNKTVNSNNGTAIVEQSGRNLRCDDHKTTPPFSNSQSKQHVQLET